MSGQRIIIAVAALIGFMAILSVDWLLHTHLASLALVVVTGALALAELYPLFRRMGLEAYPEYGVAALCALFLVRGLAGYAGLDPETVRILVLLLFAVAVVAPFYPLIAATPPERRRSFERIAVTMLGLLLVWYTLSFLLELRLIGLETGEARTGLELCIVLLLSVKLGDSSAYLVGKSIGVRPLTRISPRKTWEGAGASLAGSILVATILGILFGYSWWGMLLFGTVVSIAGQMGDLLESLLKRCAGVKDSGHFLRESGGFLDTVDSLLLAAPVGYVFVRFAVI